jgi:hypothetical protein
VRRADRETGYKELERYQRWRGVVGGGRWRCVQLV